MSKDATFTVGNYFDLNSVLFMTTSFHYRQSYNRQLQKHGMSTLYTQCESFASFVQSLVALGYLPPSEVLVAMSELEQFQFDPEIPKDDMEKIEKFKSSILQYTYDTWIYGNFHIEVWNYWMPILGFK